MKILLSFLLFLCLIQGNRVQGHFSGLNVLQSLNNIVSGFIKQVPNLIPTPEEVFKASIQLLLGFPEMVIANIINTLCKNLEIKKFPYKK